jgi:hypothetical protein
MKTKKILASVLIALAIANLVLFGMKKVSLTMFWIVLGILFVAVRFGYKKEKIR